MMPKFCLVLLATFTATATAFAPTNVQAEMKPNQASPMSCIREPEAYVGPVTLVMLAYQGFLKDQGIPSAAGLISEYSAGNITPKKLVEAAVTGCLISNKLNLTENEGYINMVNEELRSLTSR